MECKNVLLGCIVVLLFGFAAGNVEQDREKCQSQLMGLATCLPYVSGEAKAPPSDCCTGFKQVLRDSRECICLLIKDRNDPSLGLKINATLALSLPARCNAPVNQSVTDCPALLHLPPNSPDAKIFEDFAKNGQKTNTTAPASSGSSSSGTTSTIADQKSDGGKKKKCLETQTVSVLLIAVAALRIISFSDSSFYLF